MTKRLQFDALIDRETDYPCHRWGGQVDHRGDPLYYNVGWHKVRAAREAWRRAHPKLMLPATAVLAHTCHFDDTLCPGGPACQHKLCVNPEHLTVRSRQELGHMIRQWQVDACLVPEPQVQIPMVTPGAVLGLTPEEQAEYDEYERMRMMNWK